MCGRARCTLRLDDVARACHRGGATVRTIHADRYLPSYNVAPGHSLPVLRMNGVASDGDAVAVQCMKWGLIPSFTNKNEKPDHFKMFNARSESVNEKASFRRLIPKNRCLVSVNGFYEWKKDGSKKQPYYIHFKDDRPLVFAALYDSWVNSEGETLHTFTILTTSSSSSLQWLHDRMPVILGDKEATDRWLKGASSEVHPLLTPYEGHDLAWYPVTPAMGKLSFDGPECIKEIPLKTEGKNTISKFFSAKQAKKEAEIKQEEEISPHNSIEAKLPNTLKKEPEPEIKQVETSSMSVKTELPECLKQEPKTEEDFNEHPQGENKLSSAEVSAESCKVKRDYMGFAFDSDRAAGESAIHQSLAKKKKEAKGAGDKQSTLFSYFGRS